MNTRSLIYFVLPASLLILPYLFFALLDGAPFYFNKESGAVENITALVLAVAFLFTLSTLFRFRAKTASSIQTSNVSIPHRGFTFVWLLIYSLGCIYFLGEEISWGQHLFDWSTPDTWLDINDQQETNLHNTSALFDQVPRLLLTIGIVIGGLFYPFFVRKRVATNDSSASIITLIMPSFQCAIAASTVLFISVHDKIYDALGIDMPAFLQINDGEVKESLIAMFLLVYIYDFYQRLKTNGHV